MFFHYGLICFECSLLYGTIGCSNSSYAFPALALETAIYPRSPSETKIWVLIVQPCAIAFGVHPLKKALQVSLPYTAGGDTLICLPPVIYPHSSSVFVRWVPCSFNRGKWQPS